jgi:hypothetical protein
MARIEWVKQRLDNWALWHERMAGGGLGFASQSSFLKEVDSSRYREAWVPCDEVEAGVTDQGVASMKDPHQHLFETVIAIYLEDSGIKGAAVRRRCAESTIHAHLSQADAYLARWFTERKRVQEEARAARESVLRAARS